jgi:hypothetical protein
MIRVRRRNDKQMMHRDRAWRRDTYDYRPAAEQQWPLEADSAAHPDLIERSLERLNGLAEEASED